MDNLCNNKSLLLDFKFEKFLLHLHDFEGFKYGLYGSPSQKAPAKMNTLYNSKLIQLSSYSLVF